MTKTITLFIAFALLVFTEINAQNVGIGIATPLAKTHVNQTAAVDGILVDHAGAGGNSLELVPTNTANASSVIWLRNSSGGTGINLNMNTNTSTATGINFTMAGLGIGADMRMNNASSGSTGIQLIMAGTGNGQYIQHDNDGAGQFINMTSGSNGFAAQQINHVGAGYGSWIFHSGSGRGISLSHSGTGSGIFMDMSNTANNSTGLRIDHASTGSARGIDVYLTGATATGLGMGLFHSGLGRGGNISLSNPANTETGWAVFSSGTGTALYGQSVGNGLVAVTTGIEDNGATIWTSNASADTRSTGLFVIYDGAGNGGASGGGNAVEIQHNGDNGRAHNSA